MTARSVEDLWDELLVHREPEDRPEVITRLVHAGLRPADLKLVLADLGDALFAGAATRCSTASSERDLIREVLLLAELSAYVRYAGERAGAMRSNALKGLLEHSSLSQVAGLLSVSRQAVHKSVTAARPTGSYADAISQRMLSGGTFAHEALPCSAFSHDTEED